MYVLNVNIKSDFSAKKSDTIALAFYFYFIAFFVKSRCSSSNIAIAIHVCGAFPQASFALMIRNIQPSSTNKRKEYLFAGRSATT